MHYANAKRYRVSLAIAIALLLAWLAFPAPAFGQYLGLTCQANPPDPDLPITAMLVISMVTVMAIKRKYPELSLFPIAPIPTPRQNSSRRRVRR